MKKLIQMVAASLLCSVPAMAANDPASFGRDVRYLDVSTQPFSTYWYSTDINDCSPGTKCVQIGGTAPISFSEANVSRIDLPGGASNSLLCASISPSVGVTFKNNQTSNAQASTSVRLDATIQSSVLNNPFLINRQTGQAFGGKIEAQNIVRFIESMLLLPGETAQRSLTFSRHCVSGLLSVGMLQSSYGLTASQARAVFANPMIITLSAWGTMQNVDTLTFQIAFRMYGD